MQSRASNPTRSSPGRVRRPPRDVAVAVAGMLVIASTYGMARFGVGLFAPRLASERPGMAGVLDFAGTAQFAAYCVAAAVAVRFVDRRPRTFLVAAGATATLGCAGVALASDPLLLLAAVTVGGTSGGLASAALVPIIDAAVAPDRSATAQSVANAGTATGLVAVGALALLPVATTGAWLAMALFAAVVTAWCWRSARPRRTDAAPPHRGPRRPTPRLARAALVGPAVAAVLAGAGSALVWSFGPLLATEAGAVGPTGAGSLWIAAGLGGLGATATGRISRRLGVGPAWGWLAGTVAVATLLLGVAVATASGPVALLALAVFGGGYVAMTSVLILWARTTAPGSAGAAASILFIALALGQSGGSALFATLHEQLAPTVVVAVAASLCAAGGLVGRAVQTRDVRRAPSRTVGP